MLRGRLLIILFFHIQAMLQSMRYHTSKLSELVHQKRSYNLHMSSVDKIMHKNNNEFFRRSRQLSQLKSRKIQAYNHTQNIKSREIGYVNALLFTKIHKSTLLKKEDENQTFEDLQEKIQFRDAEKETKEQSQFNHHFVLRNHRQSPIHKSTLLERTRENIRLAKKIVQPVITYKTSEYQKLHQTARALKDRIMKYEPAVAKTKAELYVTKRLNVSWASIERKSQPSSPRSSLSKLNPESRNIFEMRFSEYRRS